MKIKRKTKKLIKELKNIESGLFKFSDGKYIYYSLDEYLQSLYNKIANLEKRIDKARKMIFDNYGVLDKYQIELLDDILRGEE